MGSNGPHHSGIHHIGVQVDDMEAATQLLVAMKEGGSVLKVEMVYETRSFATVKTVGS